MTNLSLYFLGSPQIELNGNPLAIRHNKAMALLIYLAVSGEPQRRDTLATLLWPDSDQKSARASLRRELSLLKKALVGDWLVIERETIGLRSDIWLDITQFKRYLAVYNTSNQTAIDALTKAIALYRSNFLEGFTLPDCPEYDEWQFFQSESLRQIFSTALEHTINGLTNQHDYQSAIPHARRWLSLDPLHEPAHQTLMRLYALSGRQAAALRQFDECQQILLDELGIEPDTETRNLEIAIRERRLKQADKVPIILSKFVTEVEETTLQQSAEPRPLFVGRELQLTNLHQALEKTMTNQGQIRFITGEAGAGKSALVSEFIHRSQSAQPELIVTTGFCDAQTGTIDPYLPFREAFKSLLINQDNQHIQKMACSALLEHGAQLLHAIVPTKEIQNVISTARQAGWEGDIPQATTQGLEQNKIFEQAVAVLQAIVAHFPLILVLEDLHWADSGSIGILFRLSRHLAGYPMLVIGTYRPEAVRPNEQGDGHPLKKMLLELQRNLSGVHIDLEEAQKREGQVFVDGILDAEPNRLSTDFREALRQQTGGHPLFVVELVQELKKNSVLIQDDESFWVMASDVDWLSLPTRVEGAIAGRMAQLSEAQRWLLTIASVMGENFLVEVVAHVAGEDTRELTQILSRTLQSEHHLVEAEGVERSGNQRLTIYRFRHNLMQVYLYEQLDKVQRVYLHEDVARTLEALYAGATERIALPLAHHYEMAGITQKAVDYLQMTGESAMRFGASLEARQHFSHALSLIANLPKNTVRQQQALQLQFSLGQALDTINTAGSDTVVSYTRALKLARELHDIPKTISILVALTNNYRYRSEVDLAQKYGKECLLLAEESQNPEHLMMANLALFWLALGLGQCADATSYIEKAISFYRNYKSDLSLDDAYNFGNILGLAGLVLVPLGFPDRALQYAKEGLALVQQYEHPFGTASALGLMAAVHEKRGEWQDALRYGEMMIDISKTHNFTIARTYGELHKGVSLALLGKPEEGLALIRQAIVERKAMDMEFAQNDNLAFSGLGYSLAGQVEEGLDLVNEAIIQVEISNDRQAEVKIYQIKGELLLMQDLPENEYEIAQHDAEICFRRAIKIAQDQQAKLWEARALASLCRLLHSQNRNEGCHQQLADLYAEFTEGFEIEDLRMVQTVIDQLA